MDNQSEDIKQSERTNDIANPKRELFNKFKAEKREKFNDTSASFNQMDDRPMAISKKEKV